MTFLPAQPAAQPALSQYITAGSLPEWEQLPPGCKRELVLTLANLLLDLPELRALQTTSQEVGNESQS
jgi:hypothetical protein